ncbi:MAG: sulfatase [Verrucomicrobiota bacterium]
MSIRRQFVHARTISGCLWLFSILCWGVVSLNAAEKPNILIAISDDQSWLHAGAYGDRIVKTPNFDRVAREGVLFNYAFCSSPSCTPSRGTLLTGQHHWRLEEGANLHSTLPAKFACYPDLLGRNGYHVGYTGKGWGPGKVDLSGRKENPAGPAFNKIRFQGKQRSPSQISNVNYAANFADFIGKKPEGKPFCFWFGAHEPHRAYELDSGRKAGKKIDDVKVPRYLPDLPDVRSDILDYYLEIEWFDRQLGRMLDLLEERGELDNTLLVVTSDNGMPFPRSKLNLYDSGVHMPLAIRWPAKVSRSRVVDDFVHFADLAPTFLEAAGLSVPTDMSGRSLMDVLTSTKSGMVDPSRDHVVVGRERHMLHANPGGVYAGRAIRTHRYLYIHNLFSDLYPMGHPPHYTDADRGPTKYAFMLHPDLPEVKRTFKYTLGLRPAVELYDCQKDPDQINNLATDPAHKEIRDQLAARLQAELKRSGDPRALGKKVTWDSDPYYSGSYEGWIGIQKKLMDEYQRVRRDKKE